jgi:hypothetical protein
MRIARALLSIPFLAVPLAAQEVTSGVVAPVCVQGIGACRNVVGLRLAFRSRELERVVGVNVTAWMPHKPTTGQVNGLAVGIIGTGGEYVTGIAVAPAMITARTRLSGIAASGIGIASAGEARAILVSGIGTAVAQDLTGISISGIGSAVGGSARGIIASGLGAAVAGEFKGIAVGGLGVAVSSTATGLMAVGVGGAVGGAFRGIAVGGLGFGGGGSMTGLSVAGLGIGVGGDLKGITVAGLGAGVGGKTSGLALAGIGVATSEAHAIVIAPGFFRAKRSDGDAKATGVFVATVNAVQGEQRGLSIGVVNFARSLKGVQLGVLNIVADGRSPRILPLANWR